jgi:LemA protein
MPVRKILREFYPDRFDAGRRPGRASPGSVKRARAWFHKRNTKQVIFAIVVSLVITKAIFMLYYYNTFLSMQYDVEEANAQIDTQLQRRKNIISNLNIMVMDYAKHEKALFEYTANTRKDMVAPGPGARPKKAPGPAKGLLAMGANMDAVLSRILAVAERYPGLRLSENFQRFMDGLVDAESNVAEQRMIYNQRANDMSTAVGKFPGLIFAKIFGFQAPEFFEPDEDAQKPPKIERATP